MTTKAVRELDRASSRIAGDFRNMIADGEDLMAAAATASGEEFTLARTKFEDRLRHAKTTLADLSRPVLDQTRKSASLADDYVRGNAWSAVGVAVAAGLLIGFLARRR